MNYWYFLRRRQYDRRWHTIEAQIPTSDLSVRGLGYEKGTGILLLTVIYRSKPHPNTKRNFEIYKATDFLSDLVDHIPPKSRHTVRYYGVSSNKTRGQVSRIADRIVPVSSNQKSKINNHRSEILFVPPSLLRTARSMRPLWCDLILQVWGADPALCPQCNTPMKTIGGVRRPEQVEFFLRLSGLWQGSIDIPPPPKPPFNIETFEPIMPPECAIKEWVPDDEPPDLWDHQGGRLAQYCPLWPPEPDFAKNGGGQNARATGGPGILPET